MDKLTTKYVKKSTKDVYELVELIEGTMQSTYILRDSKCNVIRVNSKNLFSRYALVTECGYKNFINPYGRKKKIKQPKLKVEKEIKLKKGRSRTVQYELVREFVIKRDNYRCCDCGNDSNLETHHIKYHSQGGLDTVENLTTLCSVCHYKKHINEPVGNLMKHRLKVLGYVL